MIIIGHRGARGLAPENTIASFKKALSHNIDELEFDVRTTKDHKVILLHDDTLIDASGAALAVSKHTYDELKLHKPDLATLREVFDIVGPEKPLYIEIKTGVNTDLVVQEIRYALSHGFTSSDLRIGSFNQKILLKLHKVFPDITIVVLEEWSSVRAMYRARQLHTRRIALNQRWLWWGFVKSVSRGGWQLTAYTINSPNQADGWEKYGLHGVVTDYPDRFEQ